MFTMFVKVPAPNVAPVPPTLTIFSFMTVKSFVLKDAPVPGRPTLKNIYTVKSFALNVAPVPPIATLA